LTLFGLSFFTRHILWEKDYWGLKFVCLIETGVKESFNTAKAVKVKILKMFTWFGTRCEKGWITYYWTVYYWQTKSLLSWISNVENEKKAKHGK